MWTKSFLEIHKLTPRPSLQAINKTTALLKAAFSVFQLYLTTKTKPFIKNINKSYQFQLCVELSKHRPADRGHWSLPHKSWNGPGPAPNVTGCESFHAGTQQPIS